MYLTPLGRTSCHHFFSASLLCSSLGAERAARLGLPGSTHKKQQNQCADYHQEHKPTYEAQANADAEVELQIHLHKNFYSPLMRFCEANNSSASRLERLKKSCCQMN
jgi:hypothetical protein